jgi:hypothetical protein
MSRVPGRSASTTLEASAKPKSPNPAQRLTTACAAATSSAENGSRRYTRVLTRRARQQPLHPIRSEPESCNRVRRVQREKDQWPGGAFERGFGGLVEALVSIDSGE